MRRNTYCVRIGVCGEHVEGTPGVLSGARWVQGNVNHGLHSIWLRRNATAVTMSAKLPPLNKDYIAWVTSGEIRYQTSTNVVQQIAFTFRYLFSKVHNIMHKLNGPQVRNEQLSAGSLLENNVHINVHYCPIRGRPWVLSLSVAFHPSLHCFWSTSGWN